MCVLIVNAKNLRVLLDTNIFGFIAEMDDVDDLLLKIASSGTIVCGSEIVRKELRNIPTSQYSGVGQNLRVVCLRIYDTLVKGKRNYSVTRFVEELAAEYYSLYTGKFSWKELENDFIIVATASIHQVPIVCSEDNKTMLSEDAVSAYEKVNNTFELSVPKFVSFEDFKSIIK